MNWLNRIRGVKSEAESAQEILKQWIKKDAERGGVKVRDSFMQQGVGWQLNNPWIIADGYIKQADEDRKFDEHGLKADGELPHLELHPTSFSSGTNAIDILYVLCAIAQRKPCTAAFEWDQDMLIEANPNSDPTTLYAKFVRERQVPQEQIQKESRLAKKFALGPASMPRGYLDDVFKSIQRSNG